MVEKKDDYLEEQKEKCIKYCIKRGMSKNKALKIALEYQKIGLEFPEELIINNKILK